MTKPFLKWMQGGLAACGQAIIQWTVAGHFTFHILWLALATAALVRAAGWLVYRYGPKEVS